MHLLAPHEHKAKHLPLGVTPPLGLPGYVFPVARGASYSDTDGGLRSDIADGWPPSPEVRRRGRSAEDVVWRQLLAKQPDGSPPRPQAVAPPRHRFPRDGGSRAPASGAARLAALLLRRIGRRA